MDQLSSTAAKVEGRTEEQIGGSCLTWEGGTVLSGAKIDGNRETFLVQVAESLRGGLIHRRQEKCAFVRWGAICEGGFNIQSWG